jgi:hypothetical protein
MSTTFSPLSAATTPVNITISNLSCSTFEDVLDATTAVWEIHTTAKTNCTSTEGNSISCASAAKPANSPTCTITGTTGTGQIFCTDTSNKVAVATTELYSLYNTFSDANTTVHGFFCEWMECADATW